MTHHTIEVNSTTVAYDRLGEGPPLLLIAGGSGHGGVLAELAGLLAAHYDVVTLSSRLASDPEAVDGEQRPEVHAADALGVIDALFTSPPDVFGFSAGAITTLELLARHPDSVRLAVVHEPPLTGLLPDAARHRAAIETVRTLARAEGPEAAGAAMSAAMIGIDEKVEPVAVQRVGDWPDAYADTDPEPPTPALMELLGRLSDLQPLFIEHVLVPFTGHTPDFTELAAQDGSLIVAAGVDSRDDLPYQTAAALANRLRLPLTEFPGGHLGPVERPTQFAAALKALLTQNAACITAR